MQPDPPSRDPRFHGRQRELALLVDRSLGSRESTLIVGELPCGKGSLLRELGRRLTAAGCRHSFVEAQTLSLGATPENFWSQVLAQLGATPTSASGYREIERALRSHARDRPCVLMIDDLQTLVHLPAFASPDPWGMLRAFTQSKALTLVCTSNVDLVELTDRTKDLTLGSPFFNAMRELVLGPLGGQEAGEMLEHAAPAATADLREWVHGCCGGHPHFVHRLCSWLVSEAGGGVITGNDPRLRRRALAGCRQEMRHVFSGVWPIYPWEERWMLLRIAVTQCCAQDSPHPELPSEVATSDRGERERAFVELLEDCLSRDELKRILAEVVEQRSELLLPGDAANGGVFFREAGDVVARRGLVPRFLDRLRQWSPHRSADIERIARLWGHASRVVTSAWQPLVVHCERLVARGVVGRSLRTPGWEVTPPLLYWWLLDQVQLLVGGHDLSYWLKALRLERVPIAEGRLFLSLVQRHERCLATGAAEHTERCCQ